MVLLDKTFTKQKTVGAIARCSSPSQWKIRFFHVNQTIPDIEPSKYGRFLLD
jgi:hypothetical protein